jgi:hypothetical protein
MTPDEFGRHYHYLVFKVVCHEHRGTAFQTFFEKVMEKHDVSFIAVKPAGREGDWKCDGFSSASGTVYQCYAPESMKIARAAAKVKEDFTGAHKYWKAEMKAWIFVWSAHEALPPKVLQALENVRAGKHGVTIDDWNRQRLWTIVKALSVEIRSELLGAPPQLGAPPDATPAEIKVLLNFLTGQPLKVNDDSVVFDLTDIAEKLQKNGLSDSVRAVVTPAVPVARMVQDYITRHPDPDYSSRAAQALVAKYQELVAAGIADSDQIFWNLLNYTAGDDLREPKRFWASAGIVSYYFELCDIFER